ncbi:MAG TPA: LPS-assembly protein LptD, partial [Xanthobacteraceae bacterium]
LTGASFKVTENWILLGAARYDLAANQWDQTRFGIGYVDDCFLLSLNYITGYTYVGNNTTPVPNSGWMGGISLRTLGPDALSPTGSSY